MTASSERIGLCARCTHARIARNQHSEFWRCGAADEEPRLRRYPQLPVSRCAAFVAGRPRSRPVSSATEEEERE